MHLLEVPTALATCLLIAPSITREESASRFESCSVVKVEGPMFFSSGPCAEWKVYSSLSEVGQVVGLRLCARSAWRSASARICLRVCVDLRPVSGYVLGGSA